MNLSIGTLAPFLGAGALAFLVYALVSRVAQFSRGGNPLFDFHRQAQPARPKTADPSAAQLGTPEYKIRLMFKSWGVNVAGWEQMALYGLYGLVGAALFLAAWLLGRLPILASLAGPLLGIMFIRSAIEQRWQQERRRLDAEIPLLLTRLSSALQVRQNIQTALADEVANLDEKGPLAPWLKRFAAEMQGAHRLEALHAEAEGISSALAILVTLIRRADETGGSGYTQALRLSAERITEMLQVRAEAEATAGSARGVIRNILIMLALSVTAMFANVPKNVMPSFASLALLLIAGWAAFGLRYTDGLIREVTD